MFYIAFLGDKSMMLFESDVRPTISRYPMFEKVMGPFESREDAKYAMKLLRHEGWNPVKSGSKAKYIHERVRSPKLFDPRSFRVIDPGRKGHTKLIIGCPKGEWDERRKRCRVGTRLQSILREKVMKNPYTRTGLYYPEKGSPEAYEWSRKMLELRKRKLGYNNPEREYHDKKFLMYLRDTDKYRVGSAPYLTALGRAYAHLESARDSVDEGE